MSIQQKLSLRIGPRLHMTPSLQQAIKLLPLARLELQNYLAQEMQVNPILEEQTGQELLRRRTGVRLLKLRPA